MGNKKNLLIRILGALVLLIALWGFSIWAIFLRGIPSIENLETGNFFRENTTIYDKEGNAIYTLFKDGKRTYVNYDQISQSIKDAIISAEDKTFFENPGIDFMGLVRVGASYVTGGRFWRVWGASTISQQLIKNTILSNEVTLKRKIQEAYLSYQLNSKYSKEKILEMYLNAFSFWYNASGVEEASRTYFWKSAKDVWPLWATILASLPNGPTKYSPYAHKDRLMGKLEVFPSDDTSSRISIMTADDRKTYAPLYNAYKSYLSGMTMERETGGLKVCGIEKSYIKDRKFSPDSRGCLEIGFGQVSEFFGNINITKDIIATEWSGSYTIEYTIGRKDFVASQMLENGKIDGETFKKILYDGLEFEFKKYSENIKYPYFVMFVKEYLETKYGKDIDVTNGLKVYTTLDPKLQDYAEEVLKKQVEVNKSQYGATSASLVSMNNVTGELISMVGGPDYFDEANGGNNNMTTRAKQPGSSFKPIVYSLAISKNAIGPASPIADVRTEFGKWKPENYDGSYKGMMTVETALAYSRNIPAAKMYYLAGQEDDIVKHGRNLGLSTLKDNASYGAPIAIGTAEVKPIDMLQAYSVFANDGVKKPIYFIQKIEDSNGNVIEEHRDKAGEEVFSPAASYIIATILSNEEAKPASTLWRTNLSLPGRKVAAKTGTSNKDFSKNGVKKILPNNLWTIGFTPQITTVVWAGNVDGKETKWNADGLNVAAPIWRNFMIKAHEWLQKEEFKKPKNLYTYTISKLTGLLATDTTPSDLTRSTIMAVELKTADNGVESSEIDSLCNGPVTDETPADARKVLYRPTGKPVIDGYDPSWYAGFLSASKMRWYDTGTGGLSQEPCFRPKVAGGVSLNATQDGKTITIEWNGNRIIDRIIASVDGKAVKEINLPEGSGSTVGKTTITLDTPNSATIELIDVYGYRYWSSTNGGSNLPKTELPNPISGNESGWAAPVITMINPKWPLLRLYVGDMFNLRFQAQISTTVREIDVSIDGKSVQSATSGDIFIFPISSAGLDEWKHTVTISAKDANMQSATKSFNLLILPR